MKTFIAQSTSMLMVLISAIAISVSGSVAKLWKSKDVSVVGLTTEELSFFNL
jgi:hypothetical protein